MTPEQIAFSETVRDHLTQQKARSVNTDGYYCRYRGEGGNKCAVGCLITDQIYNITPIEGACADADRVIKSLSASLEFEVTRKDASVLLLWQQYHDTSIDVHVHESERKADSPSYGKWIATGDENHSPATAFNQLMAGEYQ